MNEATKQWAENQRALARALGLSLEEWLDVLGRAAVPGPGLTASVIGAAMARGLGMSVLDGLDPPALVARARVLIDPRPPRVENPILKEAIRRADDLGPRTGASRLKKKSAASLDVEASPPPEPKQAPRPPRRGADQSIPSASTSTPDAPGEE